MPARPIDTAVTSVAGYLAAIERIVIAWTPRGADWYLQPWFRGHGNAAGTLWAARRAPQLSDSRRDAIEAPVAAGAALVGRVE